MNEKLKKKRDKLKDLYEKKEALEASIAKTEAEIKDLELIQLKKEFDETKEVISSNGLSLEEVLNAIQNNNLSSLQDKIRQAQLKKTEE